MRSFPEIFKRDRYAFLIWMLAALLLIILFYQPFEQPIQFDRAYLVYMAQLVARGDYLYSASSYGYTPLGSLLSGAVMALGKPAGFSSLAMSSITGIGLYMLSGGAFYLLARGIFKKQSTALLAGILWLSLGYLPILSGVGAEPKLWVLFFSILGLLAFHHKRFLGTGLFFSLAAMCWQVAVFSLFAVFLCLPWRSKKLKKSIFHLFFGVFLGTLPALIYMFWTNGWWDFWQQGVLRKLAFEGDQLGEFLLSWLPKAVYPYFIPDLLHFLGALFGFGLILGRNLFFTKGAHTFFSSPETRRFLIVYTGVWSSFNSLEFQSSVDLFPLLPVLILFSALFFDWIAQSIKIKALKMGYFLLIVIYGFIDAYFYELPYTFSEQKARVEALDRHFGKALVIWFEEYYVLLERPAPTNIIQYGVYEDFLIDQYPGFCDQTENKLILENFGQLIEVQKTKRRRSPAAQAFLDRYGFIKIDRPLTLQRGKCAEQLIQNLSKGEPHHYFEEIIPSIPWGKDFYTIEIYAVYLIQDRQNLMKAER